MKNYILIPNVQTWPASIEVQNACIEAIMEQGDCRPIVLTEEQARAMDPAIIDKFQMIVAVNKEEPTA